MTQTEPTCRVLCVQPTLAKYRAPVWRELASRPGIELRLWYGQHGSIKNVEPEGFSAEYKPLVSRRILGQEVLWHRAHTEAARDDAVDALILPWTTRYLTLGPALRHAKRRGLPVVLWGHGYSKNDSGLRRFIRDRVAKLATTLLFYDPHTAQQAIESGWPSDRVFVAPNAIDQAPIAASRAALLADPKRLRSFRQEQQIEGRDVLLYVSRFTPERRLDLLVEAMRELRDRTPQALAVLIGGGEDFERIEALVARYDLAEHVRLLGPIYEEERLDPWFVASDAFVAPSNLGLGLLHAFGFGLPVVTDDNPGGHGPEIHAYRPRYNGLAYPVGDVGRLAAALEELVTDAPLREELGRAALETVNTRYSLAAMVDGIEAAARRAAALGR